MTTQTAQIQPSPAQSYVPLYELWLSFRPRYYFSEHWSVRGRFDYTKELTNDQTTTFYREDVFLDIWTDLVYSTKLDALWPRHEGEPGRPRALADVEVQPGQRHLRHARRAPAACSTSSRSAGEDAPSFNDLHVAPELHVPAPVHHRDDADLSTATSSTRGKTWATTTTRSSATRSRD